MLRTIILITRGILQEARSRRGAMSILLVAALLMIAAGSTFLAPDLVVPFRFLLYWGICGWFTLTALLLALWDMILLRIAARRERRALEKTMLDDGHPADTTAKNGAAAPPHDRP